MRPPTVTSSAFHDAEFATGSIEVVLPTLRCAAFWANSTTAKDTLKVTGTLNRFESCLHSNRDLVINGGRNTFNRTLEYASSFSTNGNDHVFAGTIAHVLPQKFPFPFTLSHYAPGGCAAARAIAANQYFVYSGHTQLRLTNLKEGLHYVNGGATVDTAGFAGAITIVATGRVHITSSAEGIRPFLDSLAVFSNGKGPNQIQLSGNQGAVTGALYAPRGEVSFSGNALTYAGLIQADRIDVSGAGNVFRADSPVQRVC